MIEFVRSMETTKIGVDHEPKKDIGILIVATGASGAGKDSVMDEFLKHEVVKTLNIQRVVTCTDRPIRDGESPSAYHFLNRDELDVLASSGELVEDLVDTGTSRKATSKSEIARLLSGENLFWRIDPSRAAEIANGEFFGKHFSADAEVLNMNTLVVCINAPKAVIEQRRKGRDKDKYDPNEYNERDAQEAPHLDILMKKAIVVENLDNQLQLTVETVAELVKQHHAKVKKSLT